LRQSNPHLHSQPDLSFLPEFFTILIEGENISIM